MNFIIISGFCLDRRVWILLLGALFLRSSGLCAPQLGEGRARLGEGRPQWKSGAAGPTQVEFVNGPIRTTCASNRSCHRTLGPAAVAKVPLHGAEEWGGRPLGRGWLIGRRVIQAMHPGRLNGSPVEYFRQETSDPSCSPLAGRSRLAEQHSASRCARPA